MNYFYDLGRRIKERMPFKDFGLCDRHCGIKLGPDKYILPIILTSHYC